MAVFRDFVPARSGSNAHLSTFMLPFLHGIEKWETQEEVYQENEIELMKKEEEKNETHQK